MKICDYFGYGIGLDGKKDTGFSATVRGTIIDGTTRQLTYSGWQNVPAYPIKLIVGTDGNLVKQNNNVVGFFPDNSIVESNCTSGRYDCINGECVDELVYGTPGQFASLTECQSSCGSPGCAEGYECVSIESTQQLKDCICS